MAYIAAAAIQTRVEEVLRSSAGTLRQITAATFGGDLTEGVSDSELARRGVTIARIEAREVGGGKSKNSPPVIGNLAMYDSEWSVKVIRTMDRTAQIDDATRATVKALAMKDRDVLAQALGFPGNLSTTAAGTATGIISGLFTYVSTTSAIRGAVDDGASIIETDHRFTAILRATPATS